MKEWRRSKICSGAIKTMSKERIETSEYFPEKVEMEHSCIESVPGTSQPQRNITCV